MKKLDISVEQLTGYGKKVQNALETGATVVGALVKVGEAVTSYRQSRDEEPGSTLGRIARTAALASGVTQGVGDVAKGIGELAPSLNGGPDASVNSTNGAEALQTKPEGGPVAGQLALRSALLTTA